MSYHVISFVTGTGLLGHAVKSGPAQLEDMVEVVSLVRKEGGRLVVSICEDPDAVERGGPRDLLFDLHVMPGRSEAVFTQGPAWDESLNPLLES